MDYEQRQDLIRKVEEEHGVQELFKQLGFQEVTKKGQNVYCVCPFHIGADNPTGYAYSKGFGFCFTHCHRKMDLFQIVMESKQFEFPEALNYLANLVGIDVESTYTPRISAGKDNRDFLSQIKKVKIKKKELVVNRIDPIILTTFEAVMHTKLRQEGFTEKDREYFNLGFARSGYLANRITIPIDYIDGSIVTISGRSISSEDEIKRLNERKYRFWYDIDKAVTLYNISRAIPYIEITGEVIVVEGFKSVWRLHQWGFDNCVAVMGSSLSDEQRKILLQLGCNIIICGDRDEAGEILNDQVVTECKRFSNVEVMNLRLLKIPEKSSIDDITISQFEFVYKNRR